MRGERAPPLSQNGVEGVALSHLTFNQLLSVEDVCVARPGFFGLRFPHPFQKAPVMSLGALLLPIVMSALLVWIASAIAWTAAPHHKKDFGVIPDQDDFTFGFGGRNLSPGQYWFPYTRDQEEMQSPEMIAKMEKGPEM